MNAIPRPEYPRPQFERVRWMNLNGLWQFEIDYGESGMDRRVWERTDFSDTITVPFSREDMAAYIGTDRSALSRELSAMKREGLIDYRKNVFVLKKR